MEYLDPVFVGSIFGALVLMTCLVAADRRGRLFPVCGAILVALAVGWGLAARAVAVDYRDADGFVDCWSYCTPFQTGVGATLFYGPVAAALVLITTLVLYGRRRRRAARAPRSS